MDDELLIKYLLKETRPDEDREVESWIAASDANRQRFASLELIWQASRNLAGTSAVDENEAWERFKKKAISIPQKKTVKLWERYGWMKVAAVLVLLCGAWMVYHFMDNRNETLSAHGKPLNQTLPDGSEVTLNKNSALSYSFTAGGGKRRVKLENGEVFFKVAPDKERPFIIQADEVSIEVVGTSFNVKHTADLTEVIVETGIVRVSKSGQSVALHKGEKVRVDQGKLSVQKNTDQLYNYYRSNEFIAENTPLWRVVEVLQDAYQTEIRIDNPALRDITLTTRFRNESLERIMQVIGETINCEVIRRGDTYILK